MDDIPRVATPAENVSEKQQGLALANADSSNSIGCLTNSRKKICLDIDARLKAASDAIIGKLIEKAKDGDAPALRLCVEVRAAIDAPGGPLV